MLGGRKKLSKDPQTMWEKGGKKKKLCKAEIEGVREGKTGRERGKISALFRHIKQKHFKFWIFDQHFYHS